MEFGNVLNIPTIKSQHVATNKNTEKSHDKLTFREDLKESELFNNG